MTIVNENDHVLRYLSLISVVRFYPLLLKFRTATSNIPSR